MDKYIRLSFEELYVEDGLMIVGKGLGIWSLFLKFVGWIYSSPISNAIAASLQSSPSTPSTKKLVFFFNSSEKMEIIKKMAFYCISLSF